MPLEGLDDLDLGDVVIGVASFRSATTGPKCAERRHGEVIPESDPRRPSPWATTHILHETGVRLEELMELTATALFTLETSSGEKLLLLQIVPSKSDRERVLLVSPELAHVLAAN